MATDYTSLLNNYGLQNIVGALNANPNPNSALGTDASANIPGVGDVFSDGNGRIHYLDQQSQQAYKQDGSSPVWDYIYDPNDTTSTGFQKSQVSHGGISAETLGLIAAGIVTGGIATGWGAGAAGAPGAADAGAAGAADAGAAALPAGGMTATGTLGAAPWTTDVMGANALGGGMYGTSAADIGGMMGTSGGFGAMGSGFAGVPAADLSLGGSSGFSDLISKLGNRLGKSALQNVVSDALKPNPATASQGLNGMGGALPMQQTLNYGAGAAGPLQQMSIARPFGFNDVTTHDPSTGQPYDPTYNG